VTPLDHTVTSVCPDHQWSGHAPEHMPTVASEMPAPSIAYRLPASELIAALRTDQRPGLSDEESRARLTQYGPNELAAHRPVSA
jgi:3-methyladenine DNA glycosylase AlkC